MHSTKPWYLSKGVWGAIIGAASAVTTGVTTVLVYMGKMDATGASLIVGAVASITGAVASVFAAVGRVTATERISNQGTVPPATGAMASIIIVAAFFVVVVAVAPLAGCGHTFSGQALSLDLAPQAPARLVVSVDGEEVLDAQATGAATIAVSCPAGFVPGYVGGKVACVGDE